MNTYLFTWNPVKWPWENIEDEIEQVNRNGRCSVRWSCGNTKSIQSGDRIFLMRLGKEPKGIIGSGFSSSIPFYSRHWNGENKDILYINIDFEVLLNPEKDEILKLNLLNTGNLATQIWTPQASGISIKTELVDELEAMWFDFITTNKIRNNPFHTDANKSEKIYAEGNANQIIVTKYERNPFARKVCLEHYGYSCSVCNFNFESVYGDIGKNYIHVHHLNQIANSSSEYLIDPIQDLRPICPNCHAMIHKSRNPLSLDKLKEHLKK